jgi:superfamily II DNA or RNA helicase/HKD family nuclease
MTSKEPLDLGGERQYSSGIAPGLYEEILTHELSEKIALSSGREAQIEKLDPATIPTKLGNYFKTIIQDSLTDVNKDEREEIGLRLSQEILQGLSDVLGAEGLSAIVEPLSELLAVHELLPTGSAKSIQQPLIPIGETALLTNGTGEPALSKTIEAEIDSADSIDVVMAFIFQSGLQPLVRSLKKHCEQGKKIRVLTTTYTASTELRALETLEALGAEVKVSYDTSSTRLHAKGWFFDRQRGNSTAYIGSSNLTVTAQVFGKEWNMRISERNDPEVISKFRAVFESYWHSNDFVKFDSEQFRVAIEEQRNGASGETFLIPNLELKLEPFQEELLERIAFARENGKHANLLVSATGTGKTVMAAVDYARLKSGQTPWRLLFLAHREEILKQSQAIFRYATKDPSFGELWNGNETPKDFNFVFGSVQKLNVAGVENVDPKHFDMVIIDEFHHAGAKSYERILNHLQPKELLGLTATPERTDGLDIFKWFGGEATAELRVWDAIDQDRLCPFVYFGIYDDTDLTSVPWIKGSGYDPTELSKVYTSTDYWLRKVLSETTRLVPSMSSMKALGFCVDIDHAEFMAKAFSRYGIDSAVVSSRSSKEERTSALSNLRNGELKVVFSVDIFNEGVDIPDVNTLLMLRPTQSGTLFLQQLGRGLRKSKDKTVCTVLDFIGNHRAEFNFEQKYGHLFQLGRKALEQAVQNNFSYLPSGCYFELDQKAESIVLANLKNSIPSTWLKKVEAARLMQLNERSLRLVDFLGETGLSLTDIYSNGHYWTQLLDDAGVDSGEGTDMEPKLARGIARLLHVDDVERLNAFRDFLEIPSSNNVFSQDTRHQRLVKMLLNTLFNEISQKMELTEAIEVLHRNPRIVQEILEVLEVLGHGIDHSTYELKTRANVPLRIFARYSRNEILAAMGEGDIQIVGVPAWREGVRQAKGENAEIFLMTLDKSGKTFTATTRYKDYAISDRLIHWESQSRTKENSPTGLRYRRHLEEGREILLFARIDEDDRAFRFLGCGKYLGHTGERPMAITWELARPLPAAIYVELSAAIA